MEDRAVSIIEDIIYAAVATADLGGKPWSSPVYVVYDDELHFYWASAKASQHSQNITANPKVFLAIYDSTAPWGTGVGVFIQAEATEVTDEAEIQKVCELRKKRHQQADHPPEDFMGVTPRRIYRATPRHLWINRDGSVDGKFVDERGELDIEKMKGLL